MIFLLNHIHWFNLLSNKKIIVFHVKNQIIKGKNDTSSPSCMGTCS